MAPDTIRRLFFTPAAAVARLGGGLTPLVAFDWTVGDPHTVAETRIRPAWTLTVRPDGEARPELPTEIVLRDGDQLRPVAPFLELWALTGDGPESEWRPAPVTTDLLAANGVSVADLGFTATAMNRKAVRRTGNPALTFGTFPALQVRGDDHRSTELRGESPPDAAPPMIPRDRVIPLGRVQVLKPAPQPADPPWPDTIRLDVVRVRFTPARGHFFGPPAASGPGPDGFVAVPPEHAFLDPDAAWFGADHLGPDNHAVPADTVDDTLGPNGNRVSLGVVDDTCDARVSAELPLAGAVLRARATITVGPPDFAPDRRPFLSVADELNDREHDPARDAAMTPDQRAEWVEDLFERIFETVALLDLDFWRRVRTRELTAAERRPAIPGDGVVGPRFAMGGEDRLRDPEIAVPTTSSIQPLPLSQRARDRHRELSESRVLAAWIRANPQRLRELVREPLVSPISGIGRSQDMRMPAFMRASNGGGLSLTRWQYDLLMAWADEVGAAPGIRGIDVAPAPMSPAAARRRQQVLDMLDAGGPR